MNSSNNADKNIFDLEVQRSDFFVLLDQCRKKKEFTDVQLQIGDKLFDAHRNILSLYSPVLKAMISDQWSTTNICPISEEYVDVEIVEDLLNFLYTGKIKLTPDNVQPICMAAHYLQIPTLLKPSVQHLCKLITVENVLPLFQFAVACQLETLRHLCLREIPKDDGIALQKPEVVNFSNETFKSLIAGLKDQCWTTKLRENTFHCIVRWTEKNLSERWDELPVLLESIPLEQLPLKFLTETVSVHPLVKESISCIRTVSSALVNYQPAPSAGLRKVQSLIVTGFEKETGRFCFSCYDPEIGVWKILPEMLQPRREFAHTIVNGRDIVVCSGYLANRWPKEIKCDSVEMFDWSVQAWKNLPKMPQRLKFCSMMTMNGHLYVSGHREGTLRVLYYSFEEQLWKNVKQVNVPREYFCKLVEYNNNLYLFGGGTTAVEKYDPASDEWTCITEESEMEHGDGPLMQITVHEDKVYACFMSEWLTSTAFKMFDLKTCLWTTFPNACEPKKTPRNLVSMNGRLLTVLGDTEGIYEFDSSTQNWKLFCEKDNNLDCPIFGLIAGVFECLDL